MRKYQGKANLRKILTTVMGGWSKDPLRPVTELAVNAFEVVRARSLQDAEHIPRIGIWVDESRDLFAVTDNGTGFGHHNVEAFLSVMASSKGDATDIGRHGSGRLSAFNIPGVQRMHVYTRSQDFPGGAHFALTFDDLVAAMERKLRVEPDSESHDLMPSGTGSVVLLEGVDWRAKDAPKAEVLARKLSYTLWPGMAQMVSFNGKPLPQRVTEGAVIDETMDYHGRHQFEVYVYRPPQGGGSELFSDGLMVGGEFGPLCSLREFLRGLNTDLRRLIPSILLSKELEGFVLTPSLNPFRSPHSAGLDDSVYGDTGPALDFAGFLSQQLGPQVEQVFAVDRTLSEKREAETRMQELCNRLREGGEEPPPELAGLGSSRRRSQQSAGGGSRQTPPFCVSDRSVRLNVGRMYEFRITRQISCSGRFRWDPAGSGGTLNARTGEVVEYTAGKTCGTYELKVTDANDTSKEVVISIEITDDKTLSISPSRRTIVQGDTRRFDVTDPGLLPQGATLTWEVVGAPALITAQVTAGRTYCKVAVGSKAPLGEQTLRLTVKPKKGKTQTAEAVFTVEKPEEVQMSVCVDGKWYILRVGEIRQAAFVEVDTQGNDVDIPDGVGLIKVDPDHDLVKQMRGRPKKDLGERWFEDMLLEHIVAGHVALQVEESGLTAHQGMQKFSGLLTELGATGGGKVKKTRRRTK